MTDGTELTNRPTPELGHRSPAAERMRAHRERRRLGLRCLTIQLRETEIDALIHTGLLNADVPERRIKQRRSN
jgi:hypothetical protein